MFKTLPLTHSLLLAASLPAVAQTSEVCAADPEEGALIAGPEMTGTWADTVAAIALSRDDLMMWFTMQTPFGDMALQSVLS